MNITELTLFLAHAITFTFTIALTTAVAGLTLMIAFDIGSRIWWSTRNKHQDVTHDTKEKTSNP